MSGCWYVEPYHPLLRFVSRCAIVRSDSFRQVISAATIATMWIAAAGLSACTPRSNARVRDLEPFGTLGWRTCNSSPAIPAESAGVSIRFSFTGADTSREMPVIVVSDSRDSILHEFRPSQVAPIAFLEAVRWIQIDVRSESHRHEQKTVDLKGGCVHEFRFLLVHADRSSREPANAIWSHRYTILQHDSPSRFISRF